MSDAIIIWRRPTGMTKGVTIKPSLIPRPSVFDAFLQVMSKFAIKDLGSAFNRLYAIDAYKHHYVKRDRRL